MSKKSATLKPEKLVGLTEKKAITRIRAARFRPCVIGRNDHSYYIGIGGGPARNPRFCPPGPDRLNLEIANGKVINAWIG